MKNTPRVRFKGFSGEWEKALMGNSVLVQRGGSPRPIESYITQNNDGINWIKIGDVAAGSRYITSTKEKIIPEGEKKSRKVTKGDLILSNSMSFGRPYIVLIDGCIHDGWLLIHDEKKLFNSEYLLQLLSTDYMFSQYKSLASGGVVNNLNCELVKTTTIVIPQKAEQTKIGAFFKSIDTLIAKNQQKYEKLTQMKKSLLEKMFPKADAKEPEIRFQGFSGKWKEREFYENLDTNEGIRRGPFGSAIKKDFFVKESEYVVYEQQNAIYDMYATRYNITKDKYSELIRFNLEHGDFIMSGAGTIGKISRVPQGIRKGIFNQALIRIRINEKIINSNFFLQWMRSDKMQLKLTDANPASAMVNLVPMSEVKKWKNYFPLPPEQSKIGELFRLLDKRIALQQDKIEKLKNMKRAFLAKMFV